MTEVFNLDDEFVLIGLFSKNKQKKMSYRIMEESGNSDTNELGNENKIMEFSEPGRTSICNGFPQTPDSVANEDLSNKEDQSHVSQC